MKHTKNNKTKLTASIAVVLLTISVFVAIINLPVQAQELIQESVILTPDQVPAGVYRVDTTAYLSFRPNPVGLNQIFLVNMWLNPSTHRSRYFTGYEVTITKPSGEQNVITMDSYCADTTAWFEYIADEVGTWKLKFDFPGGYFSEANLTGGYAEAPYVTFGACYYEPSSTAEQELTVQEDMVLSWPAAPLPTDYWTQPVPFENREWWPILGNYPWNGPAGGGPGWEALWDEIYPNTNKLSAPEYQFTPWVQAPNTAHIAWKRQGAISGLMGGDIGQEGLTSGGGTPNIVYAGRCYQTITKVVDGETTRVWQCYDLQTGEVYWERTGVSAPSVIEYASGTVSVPGATVSVRVTASLVSLGGGYLRKYNPLTGDMTLERSIAPLTGSGGTYYRNGYVLGVQNIGTTAAPVYRLINWTTFGTASNFADRVISNITWPWRFQPGGYVYTYGRVQADFNVGIAAFVTRTLHPDLGIVRVVNVSAASLETGTVKWQISIPDESTYSPSCILADHGKVAFLTQNGYWLAYNLNDGTLAWKSERMDYPWAAASFGAYAVQSAYGMLYRQAYDGVYAFNWTNGKIVWHYKDPTPYPYETPFVDENGVGSYPFNGRASVADGKLYTYNTEHSPSQPITRGWKVHCIDAFTGEGIWKATFSGSVGAIAGGYITVSAMDGYMYVFGKGQSATTVSAPQTSIPKGTALMITGTVLDMSPGQSGTPCVSADSMATQMEYLHRQQPIDGVDHTKTITGVPVTLTAVDQDGDWIDLGKTTTDGYYGTFGFEWTALDEGKYEIIASFEGDDSYGSSSASTYVTVGPAPSPAEPETEEPSEEAPFPTTEVAIIAAVAVVAVVAIAAYWVLKRRK